MISTTIFSAFYPFEWKLCLWDTKEEYNKNVCKEGIGTYIQEPYRTTYGKIGKQTTIPKCIGSLHLVKKFYDDYYISYLCCRALLHLLVINEDFSIINGYNVEADERYSKTMANMIKDVTTWLKTVEG